MASRAISRQYETRTEERGRMGLGFWLLVLATLAFLMPAVWLFLTALKKESEYLAYPIVFFPNPAQWVNFKLAVTLIPYGRYALNSIFLAGMSTVITTFTSAMGGYGFARHSEAKGRSFWFVMMLSMMMVPGLVTLIPRFIVYSRMEMIGTWWPWFLESVAASPFHIFLFRQFFSAIPRDLENAAEVDGCSRIRIFWQIFLPISMPVVATSSIFTFQFIWGEWLRPILYLKDDNTTLAVKMATGYRDRVLNVLVTPLMAGIVIYALPLIVIFFLGQKHIIQGVVTSGMKG